MYISYQSAWWLAFDPLKQWRRQVETYCGFPLRLTNRELLPIAEIRPDPLEAANYIKLLMSAALTSLGKARNAFNYERCRNLMLKNGV